jgi:hypothetical protein
MDSYAECRNQTIMLSVVIPNTVMLNVLPLAGQASPPLGVLWPSAWRHDIRHNDIQHKDSKHNDIQHKDSQHNDNQHNRIN